MAITRTPTQPRRRRLHGWHHTGDIGYLDEDNFLFIVDRAKDMIITGGFNVYSVEVEQRSSGASEAFRIARSSVCRTTSGANALLLWCSREPGRTVDVAAVSAFVKQRIGSVKTPKQIEVWNDLPRSKVGKVLKSEIRARLLTSGETCP